MVEVARDLVGLHATDPASVFLAAAARMREPSVAAVERALYEERTLLRMVGVRRTMFVVPRDLVPIVHSSATRALVPGERRRLIRLLEASQVTGDGEGWLRRTEEATVGSLARRGEATAAELSRDVPELRERVRMAEGRRWGGAQGVTWRVLFLLAAEGRIARGRPRGSWISSQHRWAPMESWLPGVHVELPRAEARAGLVRAWLRAFGPATAADLRWWTGWPARQVDEALRAVAPVEVALEGAPGLALADAPGLVLADDLDPEPEPEPWAALLPGLDPTVMGWAGRTWYLGEHGPALFDRSGNAGPTVWWDGRVVGGWAQRRDGEIVVRLLEDAGREAARAVDEAAADLEAWLGEVRVTPRFRTLLELELSG